MAPKESLFGPNIGPKMTPKWSRGSKIDKSEDHVVDARSLLLRIEGVRSWTNNDPKLNLWHPVFETRFRIAFWTHVGSF